MRTSPRNRSSVVAEALLLAVLVLMVGAMAAVPARASSTSKIAAAVTPATSVQFLNISATSSLSFVPDTLSVTPGALVHLVVTQEANFDHTFTLSSEVNFSLPSSDTTAQLYTYFTAHPPIVNLSLGSTPGAKFFANFTGPSAGTYEFVCLVDTHFASGMHGTMTSSASGGSSTNNAPPYGTTLLVVLVVVVIVVAAAAGAVMARRRRRPPTSPTPPATPPSS